jgi:hypothetical protein
LADISYVSMKKIFLYLTVSCLLFLYSCKKEVTSCIDLDSYNFSSGIEVTFTSCSKNELSYDWRMSGPISAPENTKGWSDRIITNTFTIPGQYSITLNTYSDFSLSGKNASTTLDFIVN